MVEALKYYRGPDEPGKFNGEWYPKFDRYERDNIVWMCAVMGYGTWNADKPDERGFWPFTRAQNGDWLGQLAQKFCKPKQHEKFGLIGTYGLDDDDTPNGKSVAAFKEDIVRDLTGRLHMLLSPGTDLSVGYLECVQDGHHDMAKNLIDGEFAEYKAAWKKRHPEHG